MPEQLECHGHQGYEEGEVRGGVGVSLPLATILWRRSAWPP